MFTDQLSEAQRRHAACPVPWGELDGYLDALVFHAKASPERPAFRFCADSGARELGFAGALEQAGLFASALLAEGARPGDRIALLLDTSPEFLAAYLGAMHAGLVPVCLALPASQRNPSEYFQRVAAILRDCGARWVAAEEFLLPAGSELQKQVPSVERVLAVPPLLEEARRLAAPPPRHRAGRADLALVQYTSGSTSRPRAIRVTHGSLLGMIRALGQALWIHEGDVVVNWLPFFHDMGLIGYVLTTAAHGARHHYLSPRQFIADPLLWLRLVSRERATFSGGASFAYRLCLKALERDPASGAGLDLSSLTRTICGGERIPARLVRDFCAAFGPYGFHPEALVPGYGLAENVLGVAYKRPGTPTRIRAVERSALETAADAAAALPGDGGAVEVVSVGHPIPGCQVRIEAPASAAAMPPGAVTVGEIVLDSDYAAPAREVRTGDLGFVDGGEVFVVGRLKELIIRAGANIAPEDLEECCAHAPGFVLGPVVALGIPSDESATENIELVAEIRESRGLSGEEIASRLAAEVLARSGHPVQRVHLVEKGQIPRTSSGKLQRGVARRLLIEGKLKCVTTA